MRHFKCRLGGCCCRNFLGKIGDSDTAKRVFSRCNSSGPGYYFVPPEQWAPPLFESEAKKLGALAEKKKIALKITPLFFMYDLERDFGIILQWCFTQDPCAFLKDNKCVVYKGRPLACRAFPLLFPPSRAAGGYSLGECHAVPKGLIPKEAAPKQAERILHDFFGKEACAASARIEKETARCIRQIGLLKKKGRFNPLTGPLSFFAEQINPGNLFGLEEFLEKEKKR